MANIFFGWRAHKPAAIAPGEVKGKAFNGFRLAASPPNFRKTRRATKKLDHRAILDNRTMI